MFFFQNHDGIFRHSVFCRCNAVFTVLSLYYSPFLQLLPLNIQQSASVKNVNGKE